MSLIFNRVIGAFLTRQSHREQLDQLSIESRSEMLHFPGFTIVKAFSNPSDKYTHPMKIYTTIDWLIIRVRLHTG